MFRLAGGLGAVVLTAACAQNPESPVSPTAAAGASAANPDGSTLKVNAPTPLFPVDGATVDTRRPTVVFTNASGRFTAAAFEYRIQLFDGAGALIGETIVGQGAGGQTSVDSAGDLNSGVDYRWRVRAESEGQAGPWSNVWSFRTPAAPSGGGGGGGGDGSIGPARSIGFQEAVGIIINIHNTLRIDL